MPTNTGWFRQSDGLVSQPPNGASVRVAAVDLGATSGRVVAITVGPEVLDAVEVHRFTDPTVLVPRLAPGGKVENTLTVDILAIWAGILEGLRQMANSGAMDSIGIDSWAVDYGLIDADGALLANPTSYRDTRTTLVPQRLYDTGITSFAELYRRTGIQFLPFNTVFQLAAEQSDNPARLAAADKLLMLPDLFNYWLTGNLATEITNASSTALVSPVFRDWDQSLIEKLGYPQRLFTEIVEPGTVIGQLPAQQVAATEDTSSAPMAISDLIGNDGSVPVIAVASHDTASAVVAVPMTSENSAYISSGTWSLVGLELTEPVLTEQARDINATNELGLDGTVRFLRNTMGLWLLSGCQEQWRLQGKDASLAELLAQAAAAEPLKWLIDADSKEFLAPGNMADRIQAAAIPTKWVVESDPNMVVEAGGSPPGLETTSPQKPQTQAEIVRCILDSLALAYAKSVKELSEAANRKVDVIHIVGGGSLNSLLCQLTADATGLKVIAGPVEAAALGNALVQARALGAIDGGLAELRAIVKKTHPLTEYLPNPNTAAKWQAAANQIKQEGVTK